MFFVINTTTFYLIFSYPVNDYLAISAAFVSLLSHRWLVRVHDYQKLYQDAVERKDVESEFFVNRLNNRLSGEVGVSKLLTLSYFYILMACLAYTSNALYLLSHVKNFDNIFTSLLWIPTSFTSATIIGFAFKKIIKG